MAISDTTARQAKAKDKPYKLPDGGGIFGCASIRGRRSFNPAICPPTSFDSGERV